MWSWCVIFFFFSAFTWIALKKKKKNPGSIARTSISCQFSSCIKAWRGCIIMLYIVHIIKSAPEECRSDFLSVQIHVWSCDRAGCSLMFTVTCCFLGLIIWLSGRCLHILVVNDARRDVSSVPIKQQKAVAKLPIHAGDGSSYVNFFSHMLTCDLWSFMYFFFLNPRHEIMWSFSLLIPMFCLFYRRTGMRRATISSVEHSTDVCLIPMRKNVLISRCQPCIRRMNLCHFLLPLSSVLVDLECL